MKTFDVDSSDIRESLDFRGLFSSASPSDIEAGCLYEYMRESRLLRDALNVEMGEERGKKGPPYGLAAPFFVGFPEEQLFRLLLRLQEAGFPRPSAQIQKVSAQLAVNQLTPQTVANNQ